MNWYKISQADDFGRPISKIPKGWKITLKKEKVNGMYEAHIWDIRPDAASRSPTPITPPVLWDTQYAAREGAIAWLNHQLSLPPE